MDIDRAASAMKRLGCVAVLLPFLVAAGGVWLWGQLVGWSEVVLVAPRNADLFYRLDGKDGSVAHATHRALSVQEGTHVLSVESPKGSHDHQLTIADGFTRLLVPAPGQCFVFLDVTNSHYYLQGMVEEPPPSAMPRPRVVGRVYEDTPVVPPTNLFWSKDALPTIAGGKSATLQLLAEVPCSNVAIDDDALLASLGYR